MACGTELGSRPWGHQLDIDKWNNLSFSLPSVNIPGSGSVGGFTLSTPNIPHLAKGGIVKARPGGTLAMIGEAGQDEAVVPLQRGGGRSALGGTTMVVNIKLPAMASDKRAWTKEIVNALIAHNRELGIRELGIG